MSLLEYSYWIPFESLHQKYHLIPGDFSITVGTLLGENTLRVREETAASTLLAIAVALNPFSFVVLNWKSCWCQLPSSFPAIMGSSNSSSCHQTIVLHIAAHCFPTILNIISSYKTFNVCSYYSHRSRKVIVICIRHIDVLMC